MGGLQHMGMLRQGDSCPAARDAAANPPKTARRRSPETHRSTEV